MKSSILILTFIFLSIYSYSFKGIANKYYDLNEYDLTISDLTYQKQLGIKKHYMGIVKAGYLIGFGNHSYDRAKFDFVNSVRINKHMAAGISIGLRYYKSTFLYTPLKGEFFVFLKDSGYTPFLSLNTGYTFKLSHNFMEGTGFTAGGSIGIGNFSMKKLTFQLAIVHELQIMKVSEYVDWRFQEKTKILNAFGLALSTKF